MSPPSPRLHPSVWNVPAAVSTDVFREGGREAIARGRAPRPVTQPHPVPRLVDDDGGPFLAVCVAERAGPKRHLLAGHRGSCLPVLPGQGDPGPTSRSPPKSLPLLGKQLRPLNPQAPPGADFRFTAHDGAERSTVIRPPSLV